MESLEQEGRSPEPLASRSSLWIQPCAAELDLEMGAGVTVVISSIEFANHSFR